MTKKILAMLLSVALVVSMIPATIFAAGASDECPVVTKYDDHSKAHCELAGVEYTKIEGSTVAPECGQDGYTLYKCDCGEYFADDIIPMDPHYTKATKPTTERVEPTCSEYGKAAGFTCDNCGELYYVYESDKEEQAAAEAAKKDKNMKEGDIAKLPHDWADPTYPGANCTAEEQVCSECGAKNPDHKPAKAHIFDYNNPLAIVKDPTTCKPGEAVFECQREGCEYKKTVLVDVTGHTEDTCKEVEAVESDCTKDKTGVAAHYVCEDCGDKFWYNEEGEFVPVTDAELVTEIVHDWGDEPSYSVAPTCTSFGADYYFCALCGENKVENYVAPWGHTTYAEAVAHDADEELVEKDGKWLTITEGNCVTGKKYEWTCHKLVHGSEEANEKNGLAADATCGFELSKTDKAIGHKETVITVPATISVPVTYKITLCTREDCVSPHVASKTFKGYTLLSEVKVVDGDVYELPEDNDYHCVKISGEKLVDLSKAKECPAHFYLLDDDAVNKPATCTEDGYDVYFCATCNEEVVLKVAKLGHDWTENYTVVGDYNCDKKTTIACGNNCGETKDVVLGHVYGEEPDYEVKVPNCQESAGKYFLCTECGEIAKIVDEVKYVYTPYFYTFEAADAAHGDLTLNKVVDGDCKKKGHIEYTCSDCDLMIWVFDETTGKHYSANAEYKEEATCHWGAGLQAFVCDRCGTPVAAENKPLDHILTKHAAVKATCTTDGTVEYYTCSRECCLEDVDPDPDKEDLQPIKYSKYEIKDPDTGKVVETLYIPIVGDDYIVEAFGHDWSETVVAPNCATPGFTHMICTNKGCGEEKVTDWVEPYGHTYDKDGDFTIDILPDCVNDGYEGFWCDDPDCTGNDGIADTEDDGIAVIKVRPAVGHKNAAGETIVDSCVDTVTDRVCVNGKTEEHEACPLTPATSGANKGKKVVGKSHDMVEKWMSPDCLNYGYEMEVCANGCGKQNVKSYIDPLGHLGVWGRNPGDYVDYADIQYYGYEFLNNNKEFKENYGKNAIIAYTEPTYEKNGSVTFTCGHCGDVVTLPVKIVGVVFEMMVDNAVVPGANYIYNADGEIVDFIPVDGDVIAVDFYMNAFETNVWGFNFELAYNATGLNYLGYKFHAAETFANYKVNNVLEDYKEYEDVNNDGVMELVKMAEDAQGTVKVSAFTENDMNGKVNDAVVNGTNKVLTLYFQAEALFSYVEKGVEEVDFDHSYNFDMERNVNGYWESTLTVTNSEGEVPSYCGWIAGETAQMMDTNDNGNFNITDLANCNKILTGEAEYEYLAAADANKDGKITITDLQLMNELLTGVSTEKEIYEKLAWTAPEGFVAA